MLKKILIVSILLLNFINAKTIIDPLGRKINVPNNPKKIVAIGPASLRLITYMQLEDRIIGTEKFEVKTANDKPYSIALGEKKIKSLPIVAAGGKPGLLPNFEKIIELKPDIIITSVYMGLKNIEVIAKKTNIPVVGLIYGGGKNFKNISYIDGASTSFKILGEVFNKEQRANELILGLQKIKKDLNSLTKKQTKTIYIGGLRHKGQRGIVATDYEYMPFNLLSIKNVFKGKKKVGSVFVQKEAILQKNPDIIFLDVGGVHKIKEDMKKDKKFYANLKAFQKKELTWLLHSNFYSVSLCNLLINSYTIANKLGMSNIDTNKKAEEIYELFFKNKSKKIIKNYYIPTKKSFIKW